MNNSQQPNIAPLWEEYGEIDVADVVVDVDAPNLLPTYTYRVPEHLRSELTVGSCVHVPFGGQEKLGYIFDRRSISSTDPLASRLKDIIARVEGAVTFNEEQAEIARYIADRYVCDLSDAVRSIAPAAMGSRVITTVRLADPKITGRDIGGAMVQAHIIETLRMLGGTAELEALRSAAKVSAFTGSYAALLRKRLLLETREVSRARIVTKTVRAYASGESFEDWKPSAAGQRILTALADFEAKGELPVFPEKLLGVAQAGIGALKTLVEKGAVVIQEVAVRRAPLSIPAHRTTAPAFTAGQHLATQWLTGEVKGQGARGKAREGQSLESREERREAWGVRRETTDALRLTPHASTALLFGVTASGKTEVYLDAIAKTLDAGRSAIVLVPEIALTTQVVEVFTGRFGDEVAVLHSRLSEGERHDEWRRLQDSHARIAVGARSAVFAPVENLGLIVMDEEHEASYKQESQPRYHARDVAAERARLAGATLLLGSATPSIETFYATEQGAITRLDMRERIDNRPMPEVEIIDLREEFKEHKALFSNRLTEEIGDRLRKGQQTILFLNRRGYSQFVLCRDCGYVARCPNCAVSLAFHAAWNALKCHHCGYGRKAPTTCPSCNGSRIRGFGIGTEKVEEEVLKLFPSARVARMDRDTTSRKGQHQSILGRFRRGEADILIGTQMVAKGLDFPNVTLVGVVSADTSINMPDFRAAERTFQLLTQVAGRAGRGIHPGNVVVQTFTPDHYGVQMAKDQDYLGFYEKEIQYRAELNYPPFRRFANIISSAEESSTARDRIEVLARAFKQTLPEEVQLIGPAPAPLSKLKNLYRWHLVLRAPVEDNLAAHIRTALERLSTSERTGLTIDVDPASMA